jgi:ADP-ribose pyrophosphatase YjhB (NUDIX family)
VKWFTVSRLGDHMEETPEGFLLIRDVAIARCGTQLYRHNEVPMLEADEAGWLRIDREPQEVFHTDTLASYEGKPLVNDHPDEPVTPANWTDLAIGHIANIRRGSNADHDLLFADILVTTDKGIRLIRAGKRAVSVGYDAAYEQQGRGRGRQTRIIANHLALVDEGRCGSRCTILDGAPRFVDAEEGPSGTPARPDTITSVPAPPKGSKVLVHGDLEALEYRAEADDTPLYQPRGWNDDLDYAQTLDVDWVEGEHPRDEAGKFAKGSHSFGRKGDNQAPAKLNGVAFKPWTPPTTAAGWEKEANSAPMFQAPKMAAPPKGKQAASGVIVHEPDGRVWVIHPKGAYGGYEATMPKGGQEQDLSLRANAIKEAFEESGLRVQLTGHAADIERDTSLARYYHAKRIGGTPDAHGRESEKVSLVEPHDIGKYLQHPNDKKLAGIIGGGKAGPAPAESTPGKPPEPGAAVKTSGWKKVGGQLGSNPGAQMLDETGKKHYVKFAKSEAHARNEHLAAKLYEAAGAPVLKTKLVDTGGKVGTATEWADRRDIDIKDADDRRQAQAHFATHAWLANWDAAGLTHDNQAEVDGEMTTLDPGGSLIFRAQGGPKGEAFGHEATEWDTLHHPVKGQFANQQAHELFGEMTPEQMRASAKKVAGVKTATIHDLVSKHGPGTVEQRKALAAKLVNRRNSIAKRAGLSTVDRKWSWRDLIAVKHWVGGLTVSIGVSRGTRARDDSQGWQGQPRVPAGQEGGGQWSEGGGGGAGPALPEMKSKYFQKEAAKFGEAVQAAYQTGGKSAALQAAQALQAKWKHSVMQAHMAKAMTAIHAHEPQEYVPESPQAPTEAEIDAMAAAHGEALAQPDPLAGATEAQMEAMLSEPITGSQKSIHAIFSSPTLTTAEKLSKLKGKLPNYLTPENKAYAEQAIAMLEGGMPAPGAPGEPSPVQAAPEPAPEASGDLPTPPPGVSGWVVGVATNPNTSAKEKVEALKAELPYTAGAEKQYTQALIQHFGGAPAPTGFEEPPPGAGLPEHDLPAPDPQSSGNLSLLAVAKQEHGSLSEKLKHINSEAKYLDTPLNHEYAEKLKTAVSGGLPPPNPDSALQMKLHKLVLENPTDTGQVEDLIATMPETSAAAEYGNKLIAAMKAKQGGAPEPAAPPNPPSATDKTQKKMFEAAQTLTKEGAIYHIEQSVKWADPSDTQTKAYGAQLLAHLKGEPAPQPDAPSGSPAGPPPKPTKPTTGSTWMTNTLEKYGEAGDIEQIKSLVKAIRRHLRGSRDLRQPMAGAPWSATAGAQPAANVALVPERHEQGAGRALQPGQGPGRGGADRPLLRQQEGTADHQSLRRQAAGAGQGAQGGAEPARGQVGAWRQRDAGPARCGGARSPEAAAAAAGTRALCRQPRPGEGAQGRHRPEPLQRAEAGPDRGDQERHRRRRAEDAGVRQRMATGDQDGRPGGDGEPCFVCRRNAERIRSARQAHSARQVEAELLRVGNHPPKIPNPGEGIAAAAWRRGDRHQPLHRQRLHHPEQRAAGR